MYKYLAKESAKFDGWRQNNCIEACDHCKICKKDDRAWEDCWSSCDACNRCHAQIHREKIYNEPYNYVFPFYQRKFSETPLAFQFCDNICGVNMCKAYRKRLDNYNQCIRCQQKGQCWSQYQNKCIDCSFDQVVKSCEDKFGCPNPNGGEFGNVPPIDPMFTDCMPCWNQYKYTTY